MAHQTSKTSRNNLLLGFLMGAVFLSSFLIVRFSLAADDNANESRCLYSLADCDNNNTACSYFNFNWTADGYPNSAGNPSCCGDDSSEYYSDGQGNLGGAGCCSSNGEYFLSCHATSNNFCLNNQSTDSSDSVCTTDNRACVYNGKAYAEYSLLDVGDSSDDLEWCHGAAISSVNGESGNAWDDQDYVLFDGNNYIAGYCQHTALNVNCDNAGPNGTCDDSDNNPDNGYCCGDDANENYVSTDCDNNSVSFCCPDDKPYVQDGACVAQCSCGDNSYDGTDYDDSQSHCDSVSAFHVNGCGSADTSWNLSSNGNSSSSCWQGMCCGDDSNEYTKVFSSCGVDNPPPYSNCTCETGNPFTACCNNYTDCAGYAGDTQGHCYNLNEVANIDPDHKWICKKDNIWKDCDSYYADCGASICGSASGVYAGESSVGMYSDTTTLECCGDDTGEYYAELCPGVTGVERKCCNDSGDKIDQNGNCVSSCPSTNQAPTISLDSPTNGTTCQSQSGVHLSWTANDPDSGPNPLQYYVYHSTDQSLVTNHDASVLVATVTSNYYDISGLNYNTTYYWTVIADDGSSQTASEIWSYTTQACDSSQPCCQADGCGFIGDGGQPRGYTDTYSCDGDTNCGGSCDIQSVDYYCQDNDSSLHQSSGATGVTCDTCEEWDGSDGCNLCSGNECGLNYDCSTSQCDLYDPDGSGPVAQQAYYQTREEDCNSCQCSAWSAYASCQDSYNNCTSNRVECYQGTGCNTANNACYCETGYDPDGSGSCVSDGTYPIVDFNWCLSAESNTVQFTSTVSGGTEPYTSYAWDFGDSSCPAGADCSQSNPLHTYPTSGVYNVTLVVTDSNSLQGQKTEQVDLNATDKNCSTPFNLNSVTAQSSGSLVLNWDYSLGNSTYAIYRADNGSSNYVQLSNPSYSCDINSCTYTDTGLQPGTQYSYYVLAINSNTYNSTVNPACDGATAPAPAHCSLSAYTKSDVSGLDVYSDGCGVIKIKWNDLGEDYTYHLYRNLSGPQNMSSSDMLGNIDRTHCSGGSCLYEDHSIIPEKVYYYKVTSDSTATGESSLDDAASGSAFSYCYRAPVWGEK